MLGNRYCLSWDRGMLLVYTLQAQFVLFYLASLCKYLVNHFIHTSFEITTTRYLLFLLLLLYFCDIIHILVFIHPVNIALPACVSVPVVFLLSFHLEELTSKCFPEAELLTQAISSKVAAQERLRSIGARATQVTFKGPLANLALPPSSPCSSPLTYLWPRYCGDSYQEFTFFSLATLTAISSFSWFSLVPVELWPLDDILNIVEEGNWDDRNSRGVLL